MHITEEGVYCDMGPLMITHLHSIDGWDAERCEGCKYCDYCFEMEMKRWEIFKEKLHENDEKI